MKILEYQYSDVDQDGWAFEKVSFLRTNLFVGNTATGKTRFLNTLFNIFRFVTSNDFKNGEWEITFNHSGDTYRWNIQTEKVNDETGKIVIERLQKKKVEGWQTLVERDEQKFMFLEDSLPKLSPKETSISLFQEESLIQPIYEGFGLMLRRRFFHDAFSQVTELAALPFQLIDDLEKEPDLTRVFRLDLKLNARLYILSKYFHDIYQELIDSFRSVFPFVEEARISDLSKIRPSMGVAANVPVFMVRERGSQSWIHLPEMSSGMQKVLLIMADIFMLPEGGIYLIDEYENSLGTNAIGFFPEFIQDIEKDIQIFITSHHPYLINEIPLQSWYVFHREGTHVNIRYGDEIAERYGKSKQQAFIQLINDPLFSRGVR